MESESDRFVLHNKVREVLGNREGDILMEHLPPAGWSHLASKDDLEITRVVLREDMSELRTELKTEMAELRGELCSQMERGFRAQTWKMMTAMISSNAAMIAAVGFIVSSMR